MTYCKFLMIAGCSMLKKELGGRYVKRNFCFAFIICLCAYVLVDKCSTRNGPEEVFYTICLSSYTLCSAIGCIRRCGRMVKRKAQQSARLLVQYSVFGHW